MLLCKNVKYLTCEGRPIRDGVPWREWTRIEIISFGSERSEHSKENRLSFLTSPAEHNLLSPRSLQRRKKIALSLLDQFAGAFPEINYEVL